MSPVLLAARCPDTAKCPRIYMSDRATLLVQGHRCDPACVEIPADLAPKALAALRRPGLPRAALEASALMGTGCISASCQQGLLDVRGVPIREAELAELAPPDHETVVEIPIAVLEEWCSRCRTTLPRQAPGR